MANIPSIFEETNWIGKIRCIDGEALWIILKQHINNFICIENDLIIERYLNKITNANIYSNVLLKRNFSTCRPYFKLV